MAYAQGACRYREFWKKLITLFACDYTKREPSMAFHTPTVLIAWAASSRLAEAVCCDEPNWQHTWWCKQHLGVASFSTPLAMVCWNHTSGLPGLSPPVDLKSSKMFTSLQSTDPYSGLDSKLGAIMKTLLWPGLYKRCWNAEEGDLVQLGWSTIAQAALVFL